MELAHKYILDISLSKEEIKELIKNHHPFLVKNIVVETNSPFWFKLLCRYPNLYKLFQTFTQVRKARKEFYKLQELKTEKDIALNAQNFQFAAFLRDKENIFKEEILNKFKISIISSYTCYIARNRKSLWVILVAKR